MTEQTEPFTVPDSVWVSPWPQPIVTIDGETAPLVTIHPDGTLEYGEGYTPDEAARLFWEAMRQWAPKQFRRPTDAAFEEGGDSSTALKGHSKDAALRAWLPVLRRAVETLPAKCMYHDDTTPHGTWREACCDTGVPARRRELAEKALAALTAEEAK